MPGENILTLGSILAWRGSAVDTPAEEGYTAAAERGTDARHRQDSDVREVGHAGADRAGIPGRFTAETA